MTILVVDDESESRKLLVALLTAEGYEIQAADTGELALASLNVTRPALILLDIRMPGMDGFEVCRRLKQHSATRDIPVVFLSASVAPFEKVEGFRIGAVDFVTKPFQPDELLARVRTHLELARLRTQLGEMVAERTAQLRESEQRFRMMADAAPVNILFSGPDRRCLFVNKPWLAFTGRSLPQCCGDGWTQDVHPDDVGELYSTYASAVENCRSFEREFRLRRADGEYRWMLVRGVPSLADAALAGYIMSVLDITDLRQNLERMIATQKLESLGLMAAGVAHDFGNLLGSILGEADLALLEMPPGAAQEHIENIVTVTSHANEIVKLLVASAGSSIDSTSLETLDINSITEQTLHMLKASVSRRAAIRCNLSNHLPGVRGNSAQLRQVVMNLITNASEALNGKEGVITVVTEKVNYGGSAGLASLDLTAGEYVRLMVADTGCGMTPDVRSRIFDQFFTTKSSGRGLGLAAVHGIVRSHGGGIDVVSEPGAGARFDVYFPVASVREPDQVPAQVA